MRTSAQTTEPGGPASAERGFTLIEMPDAAEAGFTLIEMPGPAEAGFTLIEMLVAMLILSLVGLTLARFQTFQLSGTANLTTLAGARLEADNAAVDVLAAPGAPLSGTSETGVNAGRQWAVTVTPGPPPDPAATPDLVRVDIAVAAAEGGPPLATRTLLRPRGEQREAPAR